MPKLKQSPTLEDVARLAGVSTATVSRCINSPERVVAQTKAKVNAAIRALNYTPNFAAQVMASKRTKTIGAIVPTLENAIFAKGLQSVQNALDARGYTLLVASSGYDPEIEERQIRTLIARGADGLILIGLERPAHVYDVIEQHGIPALASWVYETNTKIPCVGFDNRSAMFDLAGHVFSQGHTKVGMISGRCAGNDRAQQRVHGLRDAAEKIGINVDAIPIIETDYEISAGNAACRELLMNNELTAILCGNDVLAVGAVQYATESGRTVPDDIAITGFDGLDVASVITPKLTTVIVPHHAMGVSAAKQLVEMIETQSVATSIKLDTSITCENSCPAEA